MATTVRSIRAVGIHGRYNLELEFYPDVSILYGKNGAGKTTLLHILANILNADFERFAFLPFETIEVRLDDNQEIELREYTRREGNRIDVSLNKEKIASFSVFEVSKKSGQGDPRQVAKRVLRSEKTVRFNSCASEWASQVAKQPCEYPIDIFTVLSISR